MFKASHLNWNKLTLGVRLLFDMLHKRKQNSQTVDQQKLGKVWNFEIALYRSFMLSLSRTQDV